MSVLQEAAHVHSEPEAEAPQLDSAKKGAGAAAEVI